MAYPTISRDFGLAWHVAQDTYISRRELSDQLLDFLADLKKRQTQKKTYNRLQQRSRCEVLSTHHEAFENSYSFPVILANFRGKLHSILPPVLTRAITLLLKVL